MKRDEGPLPLIGVLRVALWCALVVGLAEVVMVRIRLLGERSFHFLSPDFIWMTPLAAAIILASAGLILVALSRVLQGRIGWGIVLWCLGYLATLGFLYRIPSAHHVALALLAAGLSFQFARQATQRMPAFERLVRRSLPWLIALVAGMGIARHAWQAWTERREVAALPSPAPGAPNVLLIILDTVRSLDLSIYGYERPTTPFLERLAARSVLFEHALSNAPWTLPSHASLFTGRVPHEHGADWLSPMESNHTSVAEAFGARGYSTAGFVGNKLYCGREKGLARGFQHYEDFNLVPGEVVRSSAYSAYYLEQGWVRHRLRFYETPGRKQGAEVTREVLSWLQGRPANRPFFVFLNYYDAHMPLVPAAPFDTMFAKGGPDGALLRRQMFEASYDGRKPTSEFLQVRRDLYDGAIAYLDQQLEQLLGELERRGDLSNTIVLITADHGELFGEHGATGHGDDLHRPALEVPLLISYPARIPGGLRVATAVSLKDVSATLLSLAGATDRPLPGRSLERYWNGEPPAGPTGGDTLIMELSYNKRLPKSSPVSKGAMASVVLDQHRLIRNGDGSFDLFDFLKDPGEVTDLSDSASFAPVLTRLRGALEATAGPPTGKGPRYRGPEALAGP